MGKFEVSIPGLQSNSNEMDRIATSLNRIVSSLNSTSVGQYSSRAQNSVNRAAGRLSGYKSTVSQMSGALGTIQRCYNSAENNAVFGETALQQLLGTASVLGQGILSTLEEKLQKVADFSGAGKVFDGLDLSDAEFLETRSDTELWQRIMDEFRKPYSTGDNHPQSGKIDIDLQDIINQPYSTGGNHPQPWGPNLKDVINVFSENTSSWREKLGGLSNFDWSESIDKLSKAKPYIISAVLSGISPVGNILYVTSGLAGGNDITFADATRTPKTDSYAEWLGYEVAEDHPGVTAWLGKAGAEAQNEWGYAGVNAYLGKATAEAKSDFKFMEKKKTKEYKDGKWTEKESLELFAAEAGGAAGVSLFAVDGKAGLGNHMLGGEVKGEGSLGNAKAGAKGKFSIGEDGINANVSGEAMVSAAEGEVSGTINILGFEITGKVGGYAGALGVEGKAGIEDNKWVCEGGVAALLGVSAGVEIGFNDEGWDNFVDFVTFWD